MSPEVVISDEIQRKHAIEAGGCLFLFHVAVGGGGSFLRTLAVQARAQVRRVPVPPIVFAVRLLELSVMLLCFVKEFGKFSDVDLSRWRRFPFAPGDPV